MNDSQCEPVLLKAAQGPNGEILEVWDYSRHYGYKNVYNLELKVTVTFPGGKEPFERKLGRMGVDEADLERVKAQLLDAFESTVVPYLFRGDFGAKLESHKRGKVKPKAAGYGGNAL